MRVTATSRDIPDSFLRRGKYVFTLMEAAETLGVSRKQATELLARLRRQHLVASISKGLYVAVPAEYRSWKIVPAEWFIDALMRHLQRPYYVGLLSAARVHGASHQAPMVFQVVTSPGPIRDRDLHRVRLRFTQSKHVEQDATQQVTVHTGFMTVSTRETTIVDLVTHYRHAGGIDNVATILREIGELSGAELTRVAARRGRALVRRTGWLVERFGTVDDLEALRQAGRVELGEPVLLNPGGPRRGTRDSDWGVRVNAAVEPDVP